MCEYQRQICIDFVAQLILHEYCIVSSMIHCSVCNNEHNVEVPLPNSYVSASFQLLVYLIINDYMERMLQSGGPSSVSGQKAGGANNRTPLQ